MHSSGPVFHLLSLVSGSMQSLLRIRGLTMCAPTLYSTAYLRNFAYKRVEQCAHVCTLKWVRQDLCIFLVEFIEQPVLDAARKSSSEPTSKSGLLRLAAEESL